MEKCEFVLNNTNNCICKTAYHNSWLFGERGKFYEKDNLCFDDVNYINKHRYNTSEDYDLSNEHYIFFNDNKWLNENTNNNINKKGKYFINCYCSYCIYSKNKYLNIYDECFCCKKRLYLKNNCVTDQKDDFIHCFDCNSILCNNCFIQGRYADSKELYCFDCRKFSIHKNQYFYFGINIDPKDDWDNASWYY